MDVPNFYFTGDDYRYRFDVDAKTRFIQFLREQFNSGAEYKNRRLKWDTAIEQKATELSHFLMGSSGEVDFTEPKPNLKRSDNVKVRRRILSLTQEEAVRLGVGKSTLHYLRQHAREGWPFRMNCKVKGKLEIGN